MTDYSARLTPDKVKDIFHLMMQEYVLPAAFNDWILTKSNHIATLMIE